MRTGTREERTTQNQINFVMLWTRSEKTEQVGQAQVGQALVALVQMSWCSSERRKS